MSQYLLLLRDSGNFDAAAIGPEEIQRIIERYKAWGAGLAAAGKLAGSHKLQDGSGRVLTPAGGKVTVTDGPYAETKEVVGGYYLLNAASYEEAVELSRGCPHLDFGSIEIREIEIV